MKVRLVFVTVALAVLLIFAGCGEEEEDEATAPAETSAMETTSETGGAGADFTLSSSDFTDGSAIPLTNACADLDGGNVSPQLSWQNPPAGTGSFVIIMDDEDPPCGQGEGACQHWSVYSIPATATTFAQGEGTTYFGPCPPDKHTYTIMLYAMADDTPEIAAGEDLNRAEFESLYGGYILDKTSIQGTFTP